MKILLDFFQPTIAKLILFALLSAFFLTDSSTFVSIKDNQNCPLNTISSVNIGYPITYYTRHYLQQSEFEIDSLSFNLILYYLLACIIMTFATFCIFVARKGPGKELLLLVGTVVNSLAIIFVVTNVLGGSWLVKSIQSQRSRTVQNFLAIGVSADSRDEKGTTFALLEASKIGNLALTKILVKSGATINLENINGTTPLHIAAKNNMHKVVAYLLNNKANPNKRDKEGKTPLHYVCGVKTVELLLDKGAKPALKDKDGKTAMHYIKNQAELEKIQASLNSQPVVPVKPVAIKPATKPKNDSKKNASPQQPLTDKKNVAPQQPLTDKKNVAPQQPLTDKKTKQPPLTPLKTPTSTISCTTSIGGSFVNHGRTYRIITSENGDITTYKGISGFVFANCPDTGFYHLIMEGKQGYRKIYANLINNKDQSAPLIYTNKKDLILDFKISTGQGKLYWYFSKDKVDNLTNAVNNDQVSTVTTNKLQVKNIDGN